MQESKRKYSELFVKVADSRRANIANGAIESQMESYRKSLK